MKIQPQNISPKKLENLKTRQLRLVFSEDAFYIINEENNTLMNVYSGNPSYVSDGRRQEVIDWFTNHYGVFGVFCGYTLTNYVLMEDIEII